MQKTDNFLDSIHFNTPANTSEETTFDSHTSDDTSIHDTTSKDNSVDNTSSKDTSLDMTPSSDTSSDDEIPVGNVSPDFSDEFKDMTPKEIEIAGLLKKLVVSYPYI